MADAEQGSHIASKQAADTIDGQATTGIGLWFVRECMAPGMFTSHMHRRHCQATHCHQACGGMIAH